MKLLRWKIILLPQLKSNQPQNSFIWFDLLIYRFYFYIFTSPIPVRRHVKRHLDSPCTYPVGTGPNKTYSYLMLEDKKNYLNSLLCLAKVYQSVIEWGFYFLAHWILCPAYNKWTRSSSWRQIGQSLKNLIACKFLFHIDRSLLRYALK